MNTLSSPIELARIYLFAIPSFQIRDNEMLSLYSASEAMNYIKFRGSFSGH